MLSGDQKLLKCSDQWGELARGWSLLCCSQSHLQSPMEPREIPKARWQPAKKQKGTVERWLGCWNRITKKNIYIVKHNNIGGIPYKYNEPALLLMLLLLMLFLFLFKLSSSKTCELCSPAGKADEGCRWRSRLLLRLSAIAKQAGVHEFDKNSTRVAAATAQARQKAEGTRPRVLKKKHLTQTSRLISLMSPLPL